MLQLAVWFIFYLLYVVFLFLCCYGHCNMAARLSRLRPTLFSIRECAVATRDLSFMPEMKMNVVMQNNQHNENNMFFSIFHLKQKGHMSLAPSNAGGWTMTSLWCDPGPRIKYIITALTKKWRPQGRERTLLAGLETWVSNNQRFHCTGGFCVFTEELQAELKWAAQPGGSLRLRCAGLYPASAARGCSSDELAILRQCHVLGETFTGTGWRMLEWKPMFFPFVGIFLSFYIAMSDVWM